MRFEAGRPGRESPTAYIFASPWIVTLALFWVFPLLFSIYLSFTDYRLLSAGTDFVGLKNYAALFSDPEFLVSLKNTAFFVFGTIPFTTILALLLALAVNRKIPLAGVFRSGFFLPSITSMVVMALIFTRLYSEGGYINLLLKLAGLPYPENGWLNSTSTALPAIMAMDVWIATGYYMLLYLAALKSIPEELYDAARLDGAGSIATFFHVTLPQLRPMTLFIVLLNTIRSFQVFLEIFVMTKGGPLSSTKTAVYFVYDVGLHKFDMGYASAAAYVLFLIIAGFAALQLKLFGFGRAVAE